MYWLHNKGGGNTVKKLTIAAVLAFGVLGLSLAPAIADNYHSNYGDGQNGAPNGYDTNGNATGDSNHYGGYGDYQNTTSYNTNGQKKGDYHQP
jgi:hypothetical protein